METPYLARAGPGAGGAVDLDVRHRSAAGVHAAAGPGTSRPRPQLWSSIARHEEGASASRHAAHENARRHRRRRPSRCRRRRSRRRTSTAEWLARPGAADVAAAASGAAPPPPRRQRAAGPRSIPPRRPPCSGPPCPRDAQPVRIDDRGGYRVAVREDPPTRSRRPRAPGWPRSWPRTASARRPAAAAAPVPRRRRARRRPRPRAPRQLRRLHPPSRVRRVLSGRRRAGRRPARASAR